MGFISEAQQSAETNSMTLMNHQERKGRLCASIFLLNERIQHGYVAVSAVCNSNRESFIIRLSLRHLIHSGADTRLQARCFAQGHLVSDGPGGRDD